MTKVMIDTNVIIDYLADRIPFADTAEKVLDLCEKNELNGVLSASAITDIYYIMHKMIGREKTLESIKLLFSVLEIAEVGKKDLLQAMKAAKMDFEDALAAVCARRVKAEYILTRNTSVFLNSPVITMTPEDFLSKLYPDS